MEPSLSEQGFNMEVEQSAQVVAKKLWKVVRIFFYMLKTNMTKSNLMLDLNLMVKRGNQALTNLFFHYHHHHHHHKHSRDHLRRYSRHHRGRTDALYSSLTCRSAGADVITSALVREYEFSCSNSPAYPFGPLHGRRKHNHHDNNHGRSLPAANGLGGGRYGDATTVAAVHRVLDMLGNSNDSAAGDSPLVMFSAARQLRVTDSPFPLKDEGGNGGGGDDMVDKAAEEFINRFYKDLKLQNKMAAGGLESPYYR